MKDMLWIDFETGGLDHNVHSALSFAMIHTRGSEILHEWYTELRPSPLVVEQQALSINKIDITKEGLDYPEFKKEYMTRINVWFFGGSDWSKGFPKAKIKPSKDNMPIMAGHNAISFDRPWLRSILGNTYDGCYYHMVDTMVLGYFAKEVELLNPEQDIKLGGLCEALKIENTYGELHNSLVDIKMTFKLWLKLLELFGKPVGETRLCGEQSVKSLAYLEDEKQMDLNLQQPLTQNGFISVAEVTGTRL